MQSTRPFEILFLTDFSNASYRSIPAMAQMADELDIRITLLHAWTGNNGTIARPNRNSEASFPKQLITRAPSASCFQRTS